MSHIDGLAANGLMSQAQVSEQSLLYMLSLLRAITIAMLLVQACPSDSGLQYNMWQSKLITNGHCCDAFKHPGSPAEAAVSNHAQCIVAQASLQRQARSLGCAAACALALTSSELAAAAAGPAVWAHLMAHLWGLCGILQHPQ